MTTRTVTRLAVIGAGTMGAQIALQAALSGLETSLTDAQPAQLDRARDTQARLLTRRVERNQLSAEARDQAVARLRLTPEVAAAVDQADYVIEAVFEDLDAKRVVFQELDRLCSPEVVLASNSSSIAISEIVTGLQHPERAVNMHFFHPVLVMKLVEVVQGPDSSAEAVATAVEVARRMGKEPVVLTREITGFIVNRVLNALMREAMWLAEEGYATPEDIDKAIKLGLNHPMGPFELADFSGLDITYNAWQHTKQTAPGPSERPPKILEEKVRAGHLGRKTGRGFYEYPGT